MTTVDEIHDRCYTPAAFSLHSFCMLPDFHQAQPVKAWRGGSLVGSDAIEQPAVVELDRGESSQRWRHPVLGVQQVRFGVLLPYRLGLV